MSWSRRQQVEGEDTNIVTRISRQQIEDAVNNIVKGIRRHQVDVSFIIKTRIWGPHTDG